MKKTFFYIKVFSGLFFMMSFSVNALLLQQSAVSFKIDPATLMIHSDKMLINQSQKAQKVSQLKYFSTHASWQWPERHMQITAWLEGQGLHLRFSTDRPQVLNWFLLPEEAKTLFLPIGEGSRIPLDNGVWKKYLTTEMRSLDTNWDLKLPLWSQEQKNKIYSWILLTPFSNQVTFSTQGTKLQMQSSHEFNRFNQNQSFELLLHVGETPLSGALRYRKYLQENGQFKSLREKIHKVPEGKKLIGATYIYLWGNMLLSPEDVKDEAGLIRYLLSPSGMKLWQKMPSSTKKTIREWKSHPLELWQKQSLIDGLNQALFALIPLNATPEQNTFLLAQKQQSDKVRELAEKQPGKYLVPSENWGEGLSKPLIESLHQAGLERLWLGTDNWTTLFLHPQAVASAKKAGYLIAGYDSYDTGIPRGVNDSWLTAQVPNALREKCAIVRTDGTKKPGFGGKGYYLNPGCMLSYSQKRMSELVQLSGINSLFLDVDGTGMVSDDAHSEHPVSAAQMSRARNARMAWFGDTIKRPLGSEDGNAVSAEHIMFAHGMETWGFGWKDQDMHKNKKSPYYLGAWWPDSQPAIFFRPAKVKPDYITVAFDPRYRLPLYQAVFHDSVINTHHWTYDNLKFSDLTITRVLLSQLYNTAPLFNLNRRTLQARLPEIKKADASFRLLHEMLWDKALIDFRWLDQQGRVQQTRFSDGSVLIANFSDQSC